MQNVFNSPQVYIRTLPYLSIKKYLTYQYEFKQSNISLDYWLQQIMHETVYR